MTPALDLTLTDGEREALVAKLQELGVHGGLLDTDDAEGFVDTLAPLLLRAGAVKGIEASAALVESKMLLHEMRSPGTGPIRAEQMAVDEAREQFVAAIRSLTRPSTEETT